MKEYEKDRLLQQYQHDKDVGAILKEQVIPISFCMPPDPFLANQKTGFSRITNWAKI